MKGQKRWLVIITVLLFSLTFGAVTAKADPLFTLRVIKQDGNPTAVDSTRTVGEDVYAQSFGMYYYYTGQTIEFRVVPAPGGVSLGGQALQADTDGTLSDGEYNITADFGELGTVSVVDGTYEAGGGYWSVNYALTGWTPPDGDSPPVYMIPISMNVCTGESIPVATMVAVIDLNPVDEDETFGDMTTDWATIEDFTNISWLTFDKYADGTHKDSSHIGTLVLGNEDDPINLCELDASGQPVTAMALFDLGEKLDIAAARMSIAEAAGALEALNKPAELTMYNLPFAGAPGIRYVPEDEEEDPVTLVEPGGEVVDLDDNPVSNYHWNGDAGTLTFAVNHWSGYEAFDLRVAGTASDFNVFMAAGNTTVSADNTWVITVTGGTVSGDVYDSDLVEVNRLPEGLTWTAAKGTGDSIVIAVGGELAVPLTYVKYVEVTIKGSALVDPGYRDSETVDLYLKPAPPQYEDAVYSARSAMYNWREPGQSALALDFGGAVDDGQAELPLGDFDLKFYGSSVSGSVYVGTNGLLGFDSDTQYTHTSATAVLGGEGGRFTGSAVAPLWMDLVADPTVSAAVYYEFRRPSGQPRELVITWKTVPDYDSWSDYDDGEGSDIPEAARATFQVVFTEGRNSILFQYKDVWFGKEYLNNGNDAGVGLQNSGGTKGMWYNFLEGKLGNNKAVKLVYPGETDDSSQGGGGGGGGGGAADPNDVSKSVQDQVNAGASPSVKTSGDALKISDTAFDKVAAAGGKLSAEFTQAGLTALLDANAVRTVAGYTGVAEISASKVAADSAGADFRLAGGDAVLAAYDFKVSVGGREVHDLNGKATIALDLSGIDLKGADPGSLKVLHRKADGTVEELAPVYSAGPPAKLTFTVESLSRFAVVAKAPLTVKLTLGQLAASAGGRPYTLEAAPFVNAGANRTLVPLRFVSEALGAEVTWLGQSRQVEIKDGAKQIVLTVGSRDILVGEVRSAIDCAPEIVSGRTFVPLRFVSEALGARVDYNANTREITITR